MALSLLIGGGVGLTSSFLGIGGGTLIVPLMPLVANLSARSAIGTSLLTVFLVALQNTYGFHRRRLVEWRMAGLIGVFAAVGSFAAGKATGFVNDRVLTFFFAVILILLALQAITGKGLSSLARRSPGSPATAGTVKPAALGVLTGFISGFTGIGGGVLVVPILSLTKWVTSEKIVPTSVATIVFTAAAGALAFASSSDTSLKLAADFSHGLQSFSLGLVRLDLAGALFLGAWGTSRLGIRYQSRLPARNRDWLVGALLLALSFQVILTSLRGT